MTPELESTQTAQIPLQVKYGLSFITGTLVGLTLALMYASWRVPDKPAVAAPAPPKTPQRQVQIVTMFDCQFLTISEPFCILHLPTCTNTHHYKQ